MSNAVKRPVVSLINWPMYSLKVGLATGLALVFVQLARIDDPVSATFVASVCTSPTVVTGMRRALEQVEGSFMGGGIACGLLMLCHDRLGFRSAMSEAFVLAAAVGFSVLATGLLRLRQAHVVAAFSALLMVLMVQKGVMTPQENISARLAAVTLGALSAMIVNFLLTSFFYRGVFKRRLQIARGLVRGALLEVAAGKGTSALDELLTLLNQLRCELGDAARERRFGFFGFARRDPAIMTLQRSSESLYEIALLARCAKLQADPASVFARAAACLRGESVKLEGTDPLSEELRRWEELMNGSMLNESLIAER